MTTENLNAGDSANGATDANGFLQTDAPIVDATGIEQGSGAQNVTHEGPKKRGRKSNAEKARMAAEAIEAGGEAPKSATSAKPRSKRAAYSEADIGTMAKQLIGLHQMAAMISGIPELHLSEPEGVMLAGAIVNVSKEYDLAIDGKTGALIQILGAAAIVYLPRVQAISNRAKQAKAARNAATVESSPH